MYIKFYKVGPYYKSILSETPIKNSMALDDEQLLIFYKWLQYGSIIHKKFDSTLTQTIVLSEDLYIDFKSQQEALKKKALQQENLQQENLQQENLQQKTLQREE